MQGLIADVCSVRSCWLVGLVLSRMVSFMWLELVYGGFLWGGRRMERVRVWVVEAGKGVSMGG